MKHKLFLQIIFIFLLILPLNLYAWDGMGHRIIAQIAYDNLTPTARNAANDLLDRLSDQYPQSSTFQTAAEWADFLRRDNVNAFDSWHFINYPYSIDGTASPNIATENIVWATNQCITVLQSTHATEFEKAIFFRFLLHFAGDAHQPLHCIALYSKEFPNGDNGGNFYHITGEPQNNLHAFWDDGLGLFNSSTCKDVPFKSGQVHCLAKQIETDYPQASFANKAQDLNPKDWSNESYNLAKSFVYSIPENTTPTTAYITQGQKIVEQQLALAGYRLANLLNTLLV